MRGLYVQSSQLIETRGVLVSRQSPPRVLDPAQAFDFDLYHSKHVISGLKWDARYKCENPGPRCTFEWVSIVDLFERAKTASGSWALTPFPRAHAKWRPPRPELQRVPVSPVVKKKQKISRSSKTVLFPNHLSSHNNRPFILTLYDCYFLYLNYRSF